MNPPFTRTEIQAAMTKNHDEITVFFSSLPSNSFFEGNDAHWSPAHHLGHLGLIHHRLASGLGLKSQLPTHQSNPRTYPQVVQAYQSALKQAQGSKLLANNPFLASPAPTATQTGLIMDFGQSSQNLLEQMRHWAESELDTRSLKHPLLGPLSVREMLLFCVHHDQHHLNALRRPLGSKLE